MKHEGGQSGQRPLAKLPLLPPLLDQEPEFAFKGQRAWVCILRSFKANLPSCAVNSLPPKGEDFALSPAREVRELRSVCDWCGKLSEEFFDLIRFKKAGAPVLGSERTESRGPA